MKIARSRRNPWMVAWCVSAQLLLAGVVASADDPDPAPPDPAPPDATPPDAVPADAMTLDAVTLKQLAGDIEAKLVATYPADEPGAAVIVSHGGRVVYHRAHGMANLELGVALEPEMVFRLGSITKQFTAAAILLLEERGELAVGDPITDYLPDYPVHGYTLTIEHLLTHTSGIFSYTSIPQYMLSKVRRDLTTDELISEFKREEMEFAPGERWTYSNSGYVLLGAIIERVSGQTYADFVQENIFRPLRLRHTHYGGHQLIPRRVSGYRRDGNGYVNARYLSMTQPHAAGALLSNVGDLALWNAALNSDQLLSDASRERMFTAYQLPGGESTSYGYGYRIGTLRGSPSISHGGGIFGFSTFAIRLPEEGVYVAVLQNGSPANPSRTAREIAALAIGKPFPDRQQAYVSPEILERYAGVYRIDDGSTRTVMVEDGRLYTQRSEGRRIEALAYSEHGFFYPDSLTHFEVGMDEQGEVAFISMFYDGADEPEKAVRIEVPVEQGETGEE